jgi:hypothetical protein
MNGIHRNPIIFDGIDPERFPVAKVSWEPRKHDLPRGANVWRSPGEKLQDTIHGQGYLAWLEPPVEGCCGSVYAPLWVPGKQYVTAFRRRSHAREPNLSGRYSGSDNGWAGM